MKKLFLMLVACSVLGGVGQGPLFARDWEKMAEDILANFQGRVISIDELNLMRCRAMLSPRVSQQQAVKIAESIGIYILKETRRERSAETPDIYVCIGDKQIATAKVARRQYVGKLDLGECE